MRADRLISILLLLQNAERRTAAELARELEVSERTIYRDIEALCASGVPLVTQSGPGGGLSLLGRYRTNLTGMNEDELRALFMAFGPANPLEPLGAGQSLRSAMRKLSAALNTGQREEEEKVRQRFLLDGSGWRHAQDAAPHLVALQRAVWDDHCLALRIQGMLPVDIEIEIEPYGLVAKAGAWYLVGMVSGAARVYAVSSVLEIEAVGRRFERDTNFDLPGFWAVYCARIEQRQQHFAVTLRASPRVLPYLRPSAETPPAPPDADGWCILRLAFESLEAARSRLLSYGGAVEVLAPEALRRSVADYAQQAATIYPENTAGRR